MMYLIPLVRMSLVVVLASILGVGCVAHRAIERSEGQLPDKGIYVVLVAGGDELSLAGEVRNALRKYGLTVVSAPQDATHDVNLAYATSSRASDLRIDRLTIEVHEVSRQSTVARYYYDRNNENTSDWTWQIQRMIDHAVGSIRQ